MIKHSLINLKDYVKKFCGDPPIGFKEVDIANDPNFVFTNDPDYETKVLYFNDGSIINVNSWIECANYVNGGWTDNMSYLQNMEGYYVAFLGIITLITVFIKKKKSRNLNILYVLIIQLLKNSKIIFQKKLNILKF